MFAPGIPLVMSEFESNNDDLASFVVSVYLLGYASGPLVIAPLSELYGRLPVYHINTALFILWNVGCAQSTSLSMLIAFRFLTGLAGACPLTIGAGSIADCFRQEERGRVMAMYTLPVLLGPSIGPVVGGYLSDYLGWRWNFYFIITVVCSPSHTPNPTLPFFISLTNSTRLALSSLFASFSNVNPTHLPSSPAASAVSAEKPVTLPSALLCNPPSLLGKSF
jgi:multidrug resistance protein